MINLLKALFRIPHSTYIFLVVIFLASTLLGGNQDRIGLSFVSLNALFSFLVIACGLLSSHSFPKTNFLWLLLLIFVFVVVSAVFRSESIIPIYSTLGNLIFAYVVYKNATARSTLLICIYSFFLFAVVFVTFYIPGVWVPFGGTNRLSYSGMNPNVVAEFITIGFISGALLIKEKSLFNSIVVRVILFTVALVPLLYTVSRKGILLFFICIGITYLLKKRKWHAGPIGFFVIVALAGVFLSEQMIVSTESQLAARLESRFYDTYETDAKTRQFLLINSFTKGMEKPVFGHGLESSRDAKFLKSIGLWDSFRKSPVNTHNGFVNLFLKGGFVFVLLHLAIFYFVFRRLFFFIKVMRDSVLRDLGILTFIYSLIFLAHILTSGNGELFKLGWFFLGLSAGVIKILERKMNLATIRFA